MAITLQPCRRVSCGSFGRVAGWLLSVTLATQAGEVVYQNGVAYRGGRPVPAHKLEPHVEHPHWRQERDLPNDPLFASQWHLLNTGQGSGTAGADVNVVPWWNFVGGTRLGTGVVIGIVDSGTETTQPDLVGNYLPALSYDFLAGDPDPSPTGGGGHGTAVAGVAAARGNNGLGVSGVAPHAAMAFWKNPLPSVPESGTLTS